MNSRWRTILLLACLAGSSGVLAAPPEGGATVTGTLVDEQGRSMSAIGPVEVELVRSFATRLGRASVEADGRFVLTHLPAGFAELRIRRPGAAPFRRPAVRVPKNGTVDLGRILLPRGETLTVQVIDPAEQPLAGVDLWVSTPDEMLDSAWRRPAAVTGADGTVIFQGLEPGQKLEVDFCRTGWTREFAELTAGPEEAYEVLLTPTVHLTGTVVDQDGKPVAGAEVWPRRNGTPYLKEGEEPSIRGRGCADGGGGDPATDSAGRFSLTHLTPGWYQIEVRHKGFVSQTLQAVEIPEAGQSGLSISLQRDGQKVEPAEPAEPVQQARPYDCTVAPAVMQPDWEIAPGSEVSGKLLGLEPAEIPWVRIAATAPCGPECAIEGFVTPDGKYHIGPLPKGEWALDAWVGKRDTRQTIDLKPEDRELVADLEFPRLTKVSGLVTGPDGKPAPYADVSFNVSFNREGSWTQWATAGTDGRFEILLEDGTYQMATHTHGFGVEEPPRQVVVAGQPVDGLEFRIPGAATLHGHVFGLEPGEIPWVDVEGPDGTYQLTAESDGTFDFPGLYPGTWEVTINAVRFSGIWEKIEREVTVHAGETDLSLEARYPTEPAAPGASQ